ncbi:hypothetical protein B0H14DRAFT_469809 [Mycena olivaceomarginata]|nr:hypothetical protein B0H14DRAFT_469809 [Mycena olivaceomarginata]
MLCSLCGCLIVFLFFFLDATTLRCKLTPCHFIETLSSRYQIQKTIPVSSHRQIGDRPVTRDSKSSQNTWPGPAIFPSTHSVVSPTHNKHTPFHSPCILRPHAFHNERTIIIWIEALVVGPGLRVGSEGRRLLHRPHLLLAQRITSTRPHSIHRATTRHDNSRPATLARRLRSFNDDQRT